MKRLLALPLLSLLGACVQGDIPVPASGPGRQDALCAISFSQWLGINSQEVQVVGRAANGANAVVSLRATEPAVTGTCEITPDYAISAIVMD
jgi:hypothetical protein